jgi:hypothetical protein
MKDRIQLFITGFIQVILVAINTYQISHSEYGGVFVVGFLISFVWSFNVKKIAFGTMRDRLIYASGAACGSLLGLIVSKYIYD